MKVVGSHGIDYHQQPQLHGHAWNTTPHHTSVFPLKTNSFPLKKMIHFLLNMVPCRATFVVFFRGGYIYQRTLGWWSFRCGLPISSSSWYVLMIYNCRVYVTSFVGCRCPSWSPACWERPLKWSWRPLQEKSRESKGTPIVPQAYLQGGCVGGVPFDSHVSQHGSK